MRSLPAAGLALALLAAWPAAAWDDHALPTAAALAELAEVGQAPVAVETLDAFLRAEGERLAPVLEEEERWARAHLPQVPPRPDALRFDPAAADLRGSFVGALRVSPRALFASYVQAVPGRAGAAGPPLAWAAASTLTQPTYLARIAFRALAAGDRVAPLDVVATASDEPDYGLDVGLFSDSGTPQGARYGFGPQPFGKPGLDFGSQAPFHIGFFHERPLLYWSAPFLRRAYPELRIHQFATLARFAFATGHPYWGYRFLGWGIHYVGDLTQPWHATPAPGAPLASIVAKSALDLVGIHGPRQRLLQLVTNRHLALEAAAFTRLWRELATGGRDGPLVTALRDARADELLGPWRESDPRDVVSATAARRASSTDAALQRALPQRWIEDPAFRAGEPGFPLDPDAELSPQQAAMLDALLVDLFRDLGAHTRRYARAVIAR